MSLFCLLWTPLFYLWRNSRGSEGGSGAAWALLLGSITALVQFFLDSPLEPGGFGFSRWINACVDIVGLPAVLPFIVYFLLVLLRIISVPVNCGNFALLWLIPQGAMRALSWSAQRDPSLLVLVPFLWTAAAAGISFFMDIMLTARIPGIILAALGFLLLPFIAATVYWAFFSQSYPLGFLLLFLTVLPMGISFFWAKNKGGQEREPSFSAPL
ncbi:MAG: hypothetical protein LBP42_03120 [Treponema sp.]|jgi:hypothetical protein|nr:hypothetical protein [Treponema sp.]